MGPLTLTILGAGPAAPNPGGANSGYLVRHGQTAVVMDCGPGTTGQLALHMSPAHVDGVAISHFHPDHYFDLVALYYMLKFGDRRASRLPVWLPPEGRAFLDRFGRVISDRSAMLEDVLDLREYEPEREMRIGELHFTFLPVQHYVPSHAMRVHAAGGGMLVFSADAAPCDALPDAARGADLFLCESALLDATQDERKPENRGHLTAAEAAAAARAAGVKRLLITHYRSSQEHDRHHLTTAAAVYKGPIDLARPGETYTVT
ncbi:MAG: MBL fold metallo-hydrolase [Chloroflexi bacterium]|nr:MBL fold metallo-hydrolase [Chloroflexota bacterium]